jgi:hypothetical protein
MKGKIEWKKGKENIWKQKEKIKHSLDLNVTRSNT